MALPSVLEELDRLFEELVRRPWGSISRRLVPAEIREVADGWIVELPVEGLRAADLKVDVQGKQLTVTGHRRLHRERRHDKAAWTQTQQEVSLHRTLRLPSGANPDDIEAKLEARPSPFTSVNANRDARRPARPRDEAGDDAA